MNDNFDNAQILHAKPAKKKKLGSHFLEEGLKTFREREAVYGEEGFRVQGAVLRALFPNGVKLETEEDMNRFYLLNMTLMKLVRYVENWDKGGHDDSSLDAMVYWSILSAFDFNERGPQ